MQLLTRYKLDRSCLTPKVASNNKQNMLIHQNIPSKVTRESVGCNRRMTSCSKRVQGPPKATSHHQKVQSMVKSCTSSSKVMSHHQRTPTHHQNGCPSGMVNPTIIKPLQRKTSSSRSSSKVEKVNIQDESMVHHLFKGCPIISRCRVLKSKPNVALGCIVQGVGFMPI